MSQSRAALETAWKAARARLTAAKAEEEALRKALAAAIEPELQAIIDAEGKPYARRTFGDSIIARQTTAVKWDSDALMTAGKTDREVRAALTIKASINAKAWAALSDRAKASLMSARTVKVTTSISLAGEEEGEE